MSRSSNSFFDGDDEVDPDNVQRNVFDNEEQRSEEHQRSILMHEAEKRGMIRMEQLRGRSPAGDRRDRMEHSSNSPMREGLPDSGFHLRRGASMEEMMEMVCKKMGDGFDRINARLTRVEKNQLTLEKNQISLETSHRNYESGIHVPTSSLPANVTQRRGSMSSRNDIGRHFAPGDSGSEEEEEVEVKRSRKLKIISTPGASAAFGDVKLLS